MSARSVASNQRDRSPVTLDQVVGAAFEAIASSVADALKLIGEAAVADDKTPLLNALAYRRTAPALLASVERSHVFIHGDINAFKTVNARHSMQGGDMAIRHVGTLLKEIATECNAHAFRPSGDEFALLVPPDMVERFRELAKAKLSSTVLRYNDVDITVAMSFGLAVPGDDEEFHEVTARAERACSHAKREDGATVEWTPTLEASLPVNHRCTCKGCGTKFDCLIPRDADRGDIWCPNCHAPIAMTPPG